ncbi:hypothetical protein FLA_1273 [Filimonas lacunae]|nr:hypothetical protein FLA_1273 [Filimonas lacunae]
MLLFFNRPEGLLKNNNSPHYFRKRLYFLRAVGGCFGKTFSIVWEILKIWPPLMDS